MAIEIGNRVRSFDFPTGHEGRTLEGPYACYVEGRVVGLTARGGCPCYRILVDRVVFGGVESNRRTGYHVTPPVNGTPKAFGGVTDFVELI